MMQSTGRVVGAAAVVCTILSSTLANAGGSPQELGRAIAETRCARCHAIGTKGESPVAIAPPFRTLSQRYPVEHLAEALAEGIVVGHPLMPEFTFDPPEIDALLTYIESLSAGRGTRPRRP
jgi:mono/diheme cytochrome c family protein